jgi:hypothetical protein
MFCFITFIHVFQAKDYHKLYTWMCIYCGVAPKVPLLINSYASSSGSIGNDRTFTQQPYYLGLH